MRKINNCWLLVGALLTAGPTWAVNKCTGADGKVSYQETPCAVSGQTLNIRKTSNSAEVNAQSNAQERLNKLKRDNAMSEAIRTNTPIVGMTLAELEKAMGPATKVNADNYNGTRRDQVIYERPRETWYVYTSNGLVESVQHRPGAPIGASTASPQQGRCPSSVEINNAITAASSMTVSDMERAERWKSIRQMQACGKS